MSVLGPPAAPPQLVTVVIPARDEEALIEHQLEALAQQDHTGDWEVVVVDDGSRDRTGKVAQTHRHALPDLRVIRTDRDRYGLNAARNLGAEHARGDLVAFCDADDVVSTGWLGALVRAAPGSHIVGGPLDHKLLNGHPLVSSWQPAVNEALDVQGGFLEYAPGGNCAIWRDVALAVRWDEGLRFAGSDLDFNWRAQLLGYEVGFAPGALVHRRVASSSMALAHRWFQYGKIWPLLYRRYRDHGMPAPDRAEVVRTWKWLLTNAPITRDAGHAGDWMRRAAFRFGCLVGSVRYGAVYP